MTGDRLDPSWDVGAGDFVVSHLVRRLMMKHKLGVVDQWAVLLCHCTEKQQIYVTRLTKNSMGKNTKCTHGQGQIQQQIQEVICSPGQFVIRPYMMWYECASVYVWDLISVQKEVEEKKKQGNKNDEDGGGDSDVNRTALALALQMVSDILLVPGSYFQ